MLSYPIRVKALCLISRVEPMFRRRAHWLKGMVNNKRWTAVYVTGAPSLGQCFFFPDVGRVVSKGSQLPLGQSIDSGGIGAALLRRTCFLCSLAPGVVRSSWPTKPAYKGRATLPKVYGATISPRYSSSPVKITFLPNLPSLPYLVFLSFFPSPESTPLLNHFLKWLHKSLFQALLLEKTALEPCSRWKILPGVRRRGLIEDFGILGVPFRVWYNTKSWGAIKTNLAARVCKW